MLIVIDYDLVLNVWWRFSEAQTFKPYRGTQPEPFNSDVNGKRIDFMDTARIQLAKHVLEMIGSGVPVPFDDAIQLRYWALLPEDSTLPLAEIALKIVESDEIPNSR